jgi:L-alanine-DL-glutamate epimerase-like enolase superfamily enzyme
MKIEQIEALPLAAKIEKPIRVSTTTFTEARALIVRVTTDDGLTGIGESLVRSASRATKYLVEDMLAPLIIGKDPMDLAARWWEMFLAMGLRGHTKGHFVEAISGIDVALWDLIGKALNLPVYKVLHGFGRQKIPAYGSSIFNDELAKMTARAGEFLDKGYSAIKIKLGMGLQKDVETVTAIRSEVGDDIKLMVDINSRYDAATAIRLGRRLEQFDIEWMEEPVPPHDLSGYRQVKQGQPLPLAGGEGEFCLYGFRDLLATEALDWVQPDIGRAGGLTEGMRIAALIQANNLNLAPHTGMCSALNVVAGMHYAAAAPNFGTFEFMELDHPLMDIFETPMPRPVHGELHLPDCPGLGFKLDMSKINPWIQG